MAVFPFSRLLAVHGVSLQYFPRQCISNRRVVCYYLLVRFPCLVCAHTVWHTPNQNFSRRKQHWNNVIKIFSKCTFFKVFDYKKDCPRTTFTSTACSSELDLLKTIGQHGMSTLMSGRCSRNANGDMPIFAFY